jgi:hypothetical protein
MHLLQLAGGQAWPNLLPILALEPSIVTFLKSSDPQNDYRNSIESIQEACLTLGVRFSLNVFSTKSKDPTTDECRQILRALTPDCINLTGGTKPMSIAAYDLAQRANISAFYLDTRRTNCPAEAVTSFDSIYHDQLNSKLPAIVDRITVSIALKAHGFPVPANFKSPPINWKAFAVQAAQIRSEEAADREIAKAIGHLRHQLMGNDSTMPRKGQLRKVLKIPIITTTGTAWQRYLTAASEAGIIQKAETSSITDQEFLLLHQDPETTPADSLRSLADNTFKLLEGIWFELALLDHLQKKSSFSDICWSVEADRLHGSAASSRGETDLVALNTANLSLHFISCKTTGPHGGALDHIQGLRRRATKEGGNFAKAELWIFRPKTDDHRRDLDELCKAQGVTLRVFTEAYLQQ